MRWNKRNKPTLQKPGSGFVPLPHNYDINSFELLSKQKYLKKVVQEIRNDYSLHLLIIN